MLFFLGSLALAIFVFTGAFFKSDLTGRIIICSCWIIVAVIWLGQFIVARRAKKRSE
jgi:hypothetical protein